VPRAAARRASVNHAPRSDGSLTVAARTASSAASVSCPSAMRARATRMLAASDPEAHTAQESSAASTASGSWREAPSSSAATADSTPGARDATARQELRAASMSSPCEVNA
jgi:hypothetical protein